MLAYVFWHRPEKGADTAAYEEAVRGFHRSLAHRRPAGMLGSVAFRAAELPWIEGEGEGYEDWYLLADYGSLGVLGEAAVAVGHRTSHDRAARHFGGGAAGLYLLIAGLLAPRGRAAGTSSPATWVSSAAGVTQTALGELLTDGLRADEARLWRRQLVLGPAPEFCLVSSEPAQGVKDTRLPEGWKARTIAREVLLET